VLGYKQTMKKRTSPKPVAAATRSEQSMPTSTSAATPPSPKTALQRDVEASAADAKTVAELRDRIYQLETALHQANSAAAAASAAPHAQSAQSAQSATTIIQEGQRVESELSRAQQAAAESLAAADARAAEIDQQSKQRAKLALACGPENFLVALLPPKPDDEFDESRKPRGPRTLVRAEPFFFQVKAALEHHYAQVLASARASAAGVKKVGIVISGELSDGTILQVRDQASLEYYYQHVFAAASSPPQAASGRDQHSLAPSVNRPDTAHITARLTFEDTDLDSQPEGSPADKDDEDMPLVQFHQSQQQQQQQWQAGEIMLFENAVEKFGQKWTHIATEIPTRSARQISAFARTQLGKRILHRVDSAQVRGIDSNYVEAMNVFAKTMKRQRDYDIDEAETRAGRSQKKKNRLAHQRHESFDDDDE